MEVLKKIFNTIWSFLETIVFGLSVCLVIYLFAAQPNQINGNSMHPNFENGEYILTDKISYKIGEAKRGDVVVFQAPKDPEKEFIKRVIALPGETLRLSAGKFYINNQPFDEDYLPADFITRGGSYLHEDTEIKIPENKYFVVGDNRSHSSDSREWGPVAFEKIIGKAFLRYWPISRLGLIPKITYAEKATFKAR